MPTTRLFSPVPLQANRETPLGGDQARYIGKVLRLKPGDALSLFDGSGGEYRTIIASIGKSTVVVNVGEHVDVNVESPLSIHLLQGISRGERMDFVVQKATELGVHRISPLLSEFSVVKLYGQRAEKRQGHWTKIARSACAQCGRNSVPQIDPPMQLRNWFGDNLDASCPPDSRIILTPGVSRTLSTLAKPEGQLIVLIGPEGGFSAAEYEQAAAAGFAGVGFGPRIMRTETAAIAVLAALQSLYGDLG
jgi:16S rRNA (uracil1498-N3)-methyltransferase